MLKSLSEGYGSAIVLAILGSAALGGGFWLWTAFVWFVGAALTMGIAAMRVRPVEAASKHRPVSVGIKSYSVSS